MAGFWKWGLDKIGVTQAFVDIGKENAGDIAKAGMAGAIDYLTGNSKFPARSKNMFDSKTPIDPKVDALFSYDWSQFNNFPIGCDALKLQQDCLQDTVQGLAESYGLKLYPQFYSQENLRHHMHMVSLMTKIYPLKNDQDKKKLYQAACSRSLFSGHSLGVMKSIQKDFGYENPFLNEKVDVCFEQTKKRLRRFTSSKNLKIQNQAKNFLELYQKKWQLATSLHEKKDLNIIFQNRTKLFHLTELFGSQYPDYLDDYKEPLNSTESKRIQILMQAFSFVKSDLLQNESFLGANFDDLTGIQALKNNLLDLCQGKYSTFEQIQGAQQALEEKLLESHLKKHHHFKEGEKSSLEKAINVFNHSTGDISKLPLASGVRENNIWGQLDGGLDHIFKAEYQGAMKPIGAVAHMLDKGISCITGSNPMAETIMRGLALTAGTVFAGKAGYQALQGLGGLLSPQAVQNIASAAGGESVLNGSPAIPPMPQEAPWDDFLQKLQMGSLLSTIGMNVSQMFSPIFGGGSGGGQSAQAAMNKGLRNIQAAPRGGASSPMTPESFQKRQMEELESIKSFLG